MKHKIMAMALAAGMTFTAFSGVLPQSFGFDGTSIIAQAATVKEMNVPVTLQHHDNPDNKSMGNPALIQLGKIVVDSEGKAAVQLTFQSLTIAGLGKGNLGWIKKVNSDGTMTPATIIEEYTGYTDDYNDEDSDYFDDNLNKSNDGNYWYPKTVAIPVDAEYDNQGNLIGVKESRIEVQVYVPIMEKLNAAGGGGTQLAYLDIKNGLFTGSSMTLDGNIKLNTYFNFSDSFLSDNNAKIVVSAADGRSEETPVTEAVKGDATNQYYVATKIPAKDMTTDFNVDLIDGNGKVVDSFNTNVQTYAKAVISSDADAKYKTLAAEVLNYGARAQVYFDYNYGFNSDNLANSGVKKSLKDTYKSVTLDDLSGYTYTENGTLNGLTYHGTALSFLSEVTMRHYFKLTSGDIKNHTFKVGNTTLTPKFDSVNNAYYVDIAGISAKNLATKYTLTVDNNYKLEYSALDYCCAANKLTDDDKYAIKNLTKALFKLWQAADAV